MDLGDLFDGSPEEPIHRPFPLRPKRNHPKKPLGEETLKRLNNELELIIDVGSTCCWSLLNYAKEIKEKMKNR